MAEVIDGGLKGLTAEDRAALVDYLQSLRPIHHVVQRPKRRRSTGTSDTYY